MAGENRNGVVSLDFGDGRHRFRLAMGELEELQEKTGIGPYVLWRRLLENEWRVVDVAETLRIGLVGGGLKPAEALAQLVVLAAIAGAPEEEPGKGDPPEAAIEESPFQTGASPSATGMEPPASLASESPTSDP